MYIYYIIYIYIISYIYIYYIIYIYKYIHCIFGFFLILDWFGNTMAQWWEHRRLRASRSAAALRLCGLRLCAWHDTILSQNMLKLFVSPETYWIDFAGMQNPNFSQEHGGFAGSMLIDRGVLCAFIWILPAPQSLLFASFGAAPQSLSPMVLKDGTGPLPAACGA